MQYTVQCKNEQVLNLGTYLTLTINKKTCVEHVPLLLLLYVIQNGLVTYNVHVQPQKLLLQHNHGGLCNVSKLECHALMRRIGYNLLGDLLDMLQRVNVLLRQLV